MLGDLGISWPWETMHVEALAWYVAADDTATDVTAGLLRASLCAVDEAASEPGAPSLPCTSAEAVPINKPVSYRVPIVGTGYRPPADTACG